MASSFFPKQKFLFFLLSLFLLSDYSLEIFDNKNSSVILLNSETFEQQVMNSKDIWLIVFFAHWCPHCKRFAPEFELAADSLKGIFKFGAVNAGEEKDLLARFGVEGFPTVKFFGIHKESPIDYDDERIAQAMIDFMYEKSEGIVAARTGVDYKKQKLKEMEIPEMEGDIYNLNEERFNNMVLKGDEIWLVVFYAPWCGHCKQLMPEYSRAATRLKELKHGQIKLGRIDATIFEELGKKYEINGYPTIKTFMGLKGREKKVYDFYGKRDYDGIVKYAMDRVQILKEETTKGDFRLEDL